MRLTRKRGWRAGPEGRLVSIHLGRPVSVRDTVALADARGCVSQECDCSDAIAYAEFGLRKMIEGCLRFLLGDMRIQESER